MAQGNAQADADFFRSLGDGKAARREEIKETKDVVDIGQGQASTRSSSASAAVNEAKIPYVSRQEAAQTTKIETDAERLVKGNTLTNEDQKAFDEIVGQLGRFDKLYQNFQDDYAGNMLETVGRAESTIQSKFPSFGTPGQFNWWQSLDKGDLLERHQYFGASLTQGEKEAWARTTVTPGMDPATVKANIAERRALAAKALSRKIGVYLAGDYRPEQIREQVGASLFNALKPETRDKTLQSFGADVTQAKRALGVEEPEGGQVAGENIKAPRLSAGATADLNNYARNADDFTPEGYADLAVRKLIEEGYAQPEQRDALYAKALKQAQQFFGGVDDRKSIGPGLDYSEADKAAQAGAGVGDVTVQALKNVPESLVGLAQGSIALPVDALVSLTQGERYGTFKSMTDLAGEVLSTVGGEPSGPNMRALGDMLSERYGSLGGFKNAIASDPAGVAADLSLALSGAGAALRVAPVTAKAGAALSSAGKALDPLSAAVEGLVATPKAVAALPEGIKNLPGATVGTVMGAATGVPGGQGYRRAASVGFERGKQGPTQRSEDFLGNMRGGDPSEVVARAEEAVRNMQEQASQAYQSGMIDTKNDATILGFDGIDKTLDGLRDRAFYGDQVRNQRAANVYEKMRSLVDEWKVLDPDQYHTPIGMDALKQRMGDVADDFAQANDRRASGIATGVYRSVRQEIARQVPSYDKTMRAYEDAQQTLRQIKNTFSLNPNASVDTQLRKLQSLMRNNANTNYGYRAELGKMLEERGGVQLMDDLSAQSINSVMPRGLTGLAAGTAAAGGMAGGAIQMLNPLADATALLNPANLAVLPFMSPRAMGEASYYTGVGAGKVAGVAEKGYGLVEPTMQKLLDKYRSQQTPVLAAADVGSMAQDLQPQEAPPPMDLPGLDLSTLVAQEPAVAEVPSEPSGVPELPEGTVIDEQTGELVLPDGTRIPLPRKAGGGSVSYERDWGDAAREVLKGATFSHGDEMEAAARSAASGRPYRGEVDRIRGEMTQASDAAPIKSVGWEVGGSLLPVLATRGRTNPTSSANLVQLMRRYPALAAAKRGADASRIGRVALGGIPEVAMAALYGAGEAKTMRDVPASMLREMPEALATYAALSGLVSGGGKLYNRYVRKGR